MADDGRSVTLSEVTPGQDQGSGTPESLVALLLMQTYAPLVGPVEAAERLKAAGFRVFEDENVVRVAAQILDLVCQYFYPMVTPPEDFAARLSSARAALLGEQDENALRAKALEHIETSWRNWKRPPRKLKSAGYTPETAIVGLASALTWIDPRFANLDREWMASEFRKVRTTPTSTGTPKGGRGNTRFNRLAARFAVSVGAFGDRDEKKSLRRFRDAQNAVTAKNKPKRS